MAAVIIFNGVDIGSVAGVKIEDIYVSPIQYELSARPRAVTAGASFVRNRCGSRQVIITFALPEENEVTRQRELLALSEWAKTDKEYKLELQGHPGFYLMAVCAEKPNPSLRKWWESTLRLVFNCVDDPYWISTGEKSAACGTQFTVLGDAPPLMRIERTLASQATNQSYVLDGLTMTFNTIPAGDLVIDLNDQTAVVGASSIMANYNINSKFLIPRKGTQTITGTGTVKYRERFE